MASKPVFVKDREDLLIRLRLGNVNDQNDVDRLIDTVITEVRVGIYHRLGSTRVVEIQGFTLTDNPTSDDELTLADAVVMETKWVRAKLIPVLTVYFADQSGGAQQEWNELGILRDGGGEDQETLIRRLMADVEDALERLYTGDTTESGGVQATSIEPDADDRVEPGQTAWGRNW